MGVGRKVRVEMGRAEQVEGQERLWKYAVPQRQVEAWVGAVERGNKVILKRAYGTLCGVAAVDMGRAQLEIHVLLVEEVDQCP